MDAEVHLAVDDGVGGDGYFGEQTVLPIALDSLRNLGARQVNGLTDSQSRQVGEHKVLIALDTLDGETSELQVAWRSRIRYLRVDDHVLSLRLQRSCQQG